MKLYPLKFEPILKKIIWGGSEICRFKGLDSEDSDIGESWEISQVSGSVSVVSNGDLKGTSLTELIERMPEALLGKSVFQRFGKNFPLLIKFIDAEKDLSIQVHPDDKLARQRHNTFGKTEMWYVISSKPEAKLISGFSQQIDAKEYERRIFENSFEEVLNKFEVKSGDVFFIPAGRVHSIGAGLFIAEIQQSSDITYRLYDFNRKDIQGNGRELHTELAKDALDYTLYDNLKTAYQPMENDTVSLVKCPYFITNRIELKAEEPGYDEVETQDGPKQVLMTETVEMDLDYTGLDSFVIFIALQGEGEIAYGNQLTMPFKQGETVLLPAGIESVTLSTTTELLLLETYIP